MTETLASFIARLFNARRRRRRAAVPRWTVVSARGIVVARRETQDDAHAFAVRIGGYVRLD